MSEGTKKKITALVYHVFGRCRYRLVPDWSKPKHDNSDVYTALP